jgi:hypothetical protein
VIILSAEGRAQSKRVLTPEDVEAQEKERRKKMLAEKGGEILGYTFPFWRRFVNEDGTLNREGVLKAGYSEEQLPDIERKMREGGLLSEESGDEQ